MQAPREPRSLKEIVRVERRGRDTIGKAWVRISEGEPLCGGLFIIDFPFREIAGQCSEAGKEMGTKKRCTPPDDRTVAEKLSHEGGGRATIINEAAREWREGQTRLVIYPIGGAPVFENIMRKRSFPLKLPHHVGIA